MERLNAWNKYDEDMKKKVFDFADEYRRFISLCKTERECVEEGVRILKAAGYKDLKDVIAADEKLKAGDTAIVHVQGHYVCISDYNKKTKKYLLLDSNYLPKRATSAFGDWIKVDRLLSGALESQYFYFFKLSEK